MTKLAAPIMEVRALGNRNRNQSFKLDMLKKSIQALFKRDIIHIKVNENWKREKGENGKRKNNISRLQSPT